MGDRPGQIDLSWDFVPNARYYTVEMCTDIMAPKWEPVLTTTKSSGTVKNLTTGTKHWFRVAAFNSAGIGAYSGPIHRMAP